MIDTQFRIMFTFVGGRRGCDRSSQHFPLALELRPHPLAVVILLTGEDFKENEKLLSHDVLYDAFSQNALGKNFVLNNPLKVCGPS